MSIFWLTLYITCHTTVKRNVWDYCIENTELDIIFTHVRYQLPHMILHVTCLYLTYLISIQHRLITTGNQGLGIQNRRGRVGWQPRDFCFVRFSRFSIRFTWFKIHEMSHYLLSNVIKLKDRHRVKICFIFLYKIWILYLSLYLPWYFAKKVSIWGII